MKTSLPETHSKKTPWIALGSAILITCILFLLVPLTQTLTNANKPNIKIREVKLALPLPTRLPPIPEEITKEEPKPLLNKSLKKLELHPLELSLKPGISDALAINISNSDFNTEVNVKGNIQSTFTFHDLPSIPRIINAPTYTFPRDLIRRGIRQGKVVFIITINKDGRASVESIVSSTHGKFEDPAIEVVRRARFSIPKIDGKPVQVRGSWPVVLKLP